MKLERPLFSGMVISVLLAAAFGCASSPDQSVNKAERAQRAALAKEVDEEVTVGRQMAAVLLGRLGGLKDEAALAYVNLVGQGLARKVGRPELTFHFGILDTKEINALATPGGYIFITAGLLRILRTESELAAILGHEIAHVNERHMYLKIRRTREVSAGEALTRMLSRGGSDISSLISQMAAEGVKILLHDGLSKDLEFAADEAGMVYAASAGYNPTALASFINRLHQEKSQVMISPAYPLFIDRLKALVDSLSRNALDNNMEADGELMKERFNRALSTSGEGRQP